MWQRGELSDGESCSDVESAGVIKEGADDALKALSLVLVKEWCGIFRERLCDMRAVDDGVVAHGCLLALN